MVFTMFPNSVGNDRSSSGGATPPGPTSKHHQRKQHKPKVEVAAASLRMEESAEPESLTAREIKTQPSRLHRLMSKISHIARRIFDKLCCVPRPAANQNVVPPLDECTVRNVDWEKAEPVEFEQLVLAKDREKLEADVNRAMKKIQRKILKRKSQSELRELLASCRGRDTIVYAPMTRKHKNLLHILEAWDPKRWSIEDTAGLLMDIAVKAKYLTGETVEDLLSTKLHNAREKGHGVNWMSSWVSGLENFGIEAGKGLQSGPSLSTGLVLRLLDTLGRTTDKQNEAIVNALILFWKNSKIKRLLGEYHTTVEVWSAYTRYLEERYRMLNENEL